VKTLQNQSGSPDLLVRLVNQELRQPVPPSAGVMLGPLVRVNGHFGEGAFDAPRGTKFFYVQYQRPQRALPLPDSSGDTLPSHPRPISNTGGSASGANSTTGNSNSSAPSSATPPPPTHTTDPMDPSAANSANGGSTGGSRGNSGMGRGSRSMQPIDAPDPIPGQRYTDLINAAMGRLKGRTLVIRTPVDLAKAIAVLQHGK